VSKITPNMSIYKPASGEELYNASYQIGMDHIDEHDHSGAPYNGVQIGTSGIKDKAITPDKLSADIFLEATVQTTDDVSTEITSVKIVEAEAVTIRGFFIGRKSTVLEVVGGQFFGVFYRPTGGNVTICGACEVDMESNFAEIVSFELIADVGNKTASLRCIGAVGKVINWRVNYNVVSFP
jgi:hypothetical protein